MAATAKAPSRRTDARRNREAILSAARQLFARSGEVPMYEIARAAGVGQATLYRHFPDRSSVAAAIFSEELEGLERLAAEKAGDPDAFFALMRGVAEVQTQFYGLVDCVAGVPGAPSETEELKRRFLTMVEPPMRDAKAAGLLRPDFGIEDVFLLIAMVGGALDKGAGSDQGGVLAARAQTLLVEGVGRAPGA